jgi:hypothetical protein
VISKRQGQSVRELWQDGAALDDAVRRAAIDAFHAHAWACVPMAVWRDGKVEHIDPNDPSAPVPGSFPAPRSQSPHWNAM